MANKLDLNDLTVGDCIFMHKVFGLDVICEDGNVARVAASEKDVKTCKDA